MKDLNNIEPEVRAHIYQQLVDVESLLPEGSSISVVLRDMPTKMQSIVFDVNTRMGKFSSIGRSRNIYEAIGEAKSKICAQLVVLKTLLGETEGQDVVRESMPSGVYRH